MRPPILDLKTQIYINQLYTVVVLICLSINWTAVLIIPQEREPQILACHPAPAAPLTEEGVLALADESGLNSKALQRLLEDAPGLERQIAQQSTVCRWFSCVLRRFDWLVQAFLSSILLVSALCDHSVT